MYAADEKFMIANDMQADWAIKKIAEAREDAAKWARFYDEQKSKAKQSASETEDYFMHLLKDYFEAVPRKVTKTQESYSLPRGRLIYKKMPDKYIRDEDKLLQYFKNNNYSEFIKTIEMTVWGEFKNNAEITGNQILDKRTGEIVDGVTVEDGGHAFTITFAKEQPNEQ